MVGVADADAGGGGAVFLLAPLLAFFLLLRRRHVFDLTLYKDKREVYSQCTVQEKKIRVSLSLSLCVCVSRSTLPEKLSRKSAHHARRARPSSRTTSSDALSFFALEKRWRASRV